MITDLTELRIRLETHFDIIDDEAREGTIALGRALLAGIDLVKIVERGNWTTVQEAVEAWRNRDADGQSKPKPVATVLKL
jgi:hypothetical protein